MKSSCCVLFWAVYSGHIDHTALLGIIASDAKIYLARAFQFSFISDFCWEDFISETNYYLFTYQLFNIMNFFIDFSGMFKNMLLLWFLTR